MKPVVVVVVVIMGIYRAPFCSAKTTEWITLIGRLLIFVPNQDALDRATKPSFSL